MNPESANINSIQARDAGHSAPPERTLRQAQDDLIEGLLSPAPTTLGVEDGALLAEETAALAATALEVFDLLNRGHFLGLLPAIPIDLSLDLEYRAILYYRPECRVVLSESFVREAGMEGMRQAVLHEMVHYFFHFHGIPDTSSPLLGHSKRFRYVADRVGLTLYN